VLYYIYQKRRSNNVQVYELINILERNQTMSSEVVIEVKTPISIGATPSVGISNVKFGFDWDNGKVILEPLEPLEKADIDRLKQIRELAEENARLKLSNKMLESDIKRMSKKIKKLEEEQ
jgi:hypothetical protein